jgi:hypothetical protein
VQSSRFNGACPPSPAAAISKPASSAGTSTMVTCRSARSRSAWAPRTTKIRGAGLVASIPAAIRECTDGSAATFDQARADFEDAWPVFLSNRTEADFRAWREERDWTAEKYRRFDRRERMPSRETGNRRTVPRD